MVVLLRVVRLLFWPKCVCVLVTGVLCAVGWRCWQQNACNTPVPVVQGGQLRLQRVPEPHLEVPTVYQEGQSLKGEAKREYLRTAPEVPIIIETDADQRAVAERQTRERKAANVPMRTPTGGAVVMKRIAPQKAQRSQADPRQMPSRSAAHQRPRAAVPRRAPMHSIDDLLLSLPA